MLARPSASMLPRSSIKPQQPRLSAQPPVAHNSRLLAADPAPHRPPGGRGAGLKGQPVGIQKKPSSTCATSLDSVPPPLTQSTWPHCENLQAWTSTPGLSNQSSVDALAINLHPDTCSSEGLLPQQPRLSAQLLVAHNSQLLAADPAPYRPPGGRGASLKRQPVGIQKKPSSTCSTSLDSGPPPVSTLPSCENLHAWTSSFALSNQSSVDAPAINLCPDTWRLEGVLSMQVFEFETASPVTDKPQEASQQEAPSDGWNDDNVLVQHSMNLSTHEVINLDEDAETEAGQRPSREPSRSGKPGDFTWTSEGKSPAALSIPCSTVPSGHSKQPGQPRQPAWSSALAPAIAATLRQQQESLISHQQTLHKELDDISAEMQSAIGDSGALKALVAMARIRTEDFLTRKTHFEEMMMKSRRPGKSGREQVLQGLRL